MFYAVLFVKKRRICVRVFMCVCLEEEITVDLR